MRHRDSRLLKLIALFRWMKAVLLLGGGFAVLRLLDEHTSERLQRWLAALPLGYEQRFAHKAIAYIARLNDQRVELLAAVAFAYAVLCMTEGTGLWLVKRWAEYLTIIATASLLPFEIYEAIEKVDGTPPPRVTAEPGDLLYLAWRVRHNE